MSQIFKNALSSGAHKVPLDSAARGERLGQVKVKSQRGSKGLATPNLNLASTWK